MMIEKHKKSFTIALVILSLLFVSSIPAQAADNPKTKPLPGVQILLLSGEGTKPIPQPNIAFVTSTTHNGNLGGLAGADAICQSAAAAAGLPANTYKAWLSSSAANAIDRLGTARGWVRVDGKPFADTKADIIAGKIFHPLRVYANGAFDNAPYGSFVWTGTYVDGTVTPDGNTCNNWTSALETDWGAGGADDAGTQLFGLSGDAYCDNSYRLYCFGTNKNVPVTVNRVTGRIAFFTKNPWGTPNGGLAGADALCQQEATGASLSGTFKALLAADGQTAASRFDASPGTLPWVRPDGVAIAPTSAALFTADFLDAAINQSADGLQYFGNYGAWAGAENPTTQGTANTTCNNWGSNSNAVFGMDGAAGYTYQKNFFGQSSAACDAVWKHLYCLQQ